MKKTQSISLFLAIALAFILAFSTSCASAPDPASLPQTHDEFIAAGWTEVSARLQGSVGNRNSIEKVDGFGLVDISLDDSGRPVLETLEPRSKPIIAEVVYIRREMGEQFAVIYRSPKGDTVRTTEIRWAKDKYGTTDRITNDSYYLIAGKKYSVKSLQGFLENPGTEPVTIADFRGSFETTRTVIWANLKSEFASAKSKYSAAQTKPNLQEQLQAAAILLGDSAFAEKVKGDVEATNTEVAAKLAEADAAKAAKIAEEAKFYSSYKAFADNDTTNLAMLNNRAYWKKGTIYKFSFSGSDAERNNPPKGDPNTLFGMIQNRNRVELPFMMFVIQSWITETRFVSTIATSQGAYPLTVETKGMTDWIQQNFPSGFAYCRGYFEVIETEPQVVIKPIMLGGLGQWDAEKVTGLNYDDIVRKGVGK